MKADDKCYQEERGVDGVNEGQPAKRTVILQVRFCSERQSRSVVET